MGISSIMIIIEKANKKKLIEHTHTHPKQVEKMSIKDRLNSFQLSSSSSSSSSYSLLFNLAIFTNVFFGGRGKLKRNGEKKMRKLGII